MAYFRYKVMEPTGKIKSGVINLPYKDETSASFYLGRDDRTIVSIKQMGATVSFILEKMSVIARKKPSRPIQAEFLSNISMMLKSGMTLTTAMQEAASGINIPGFEQDINDMILRIQGGATFSDTVSRYSAIFPSNIIHLIRMGEETGKLDEMLMDASEHLQRIESIISDTKQALLYPAFVFVTMALGMFFWFYYVVPKIITLFQDMDVALPTITLCLLAISTFLQNNILLLAVGLIAVLIVVFAAYRGNQGVRWGMDAFFLKLPVAGTIISASNLAFITEYFSILLNAGIDIIQTMHILKDSTKNEIYRQKLDGIIEGLQRSESISEAFRNAVVFPSFVVRMINVGELSGTLDIQLKNIADNYRNKLSLLVATLGKMIEPIVLITAGILFAIIIGGLFLPIYDLVGQVSGR
ncbi:MAG: type II secretion system F family protein [Deltaproteobacteria bacterium]|nr:type II secretion system F family protein [Deltaproteobacteria bacterium]